MRTASLKTTPACTRSVDWLSASARTVKFDVPFASAVLLNRVVAAGPGWSDELSPGGLPAGGLPAGGLPPGGGLPEVLAGGVAAVPPVPLAMFGVAVTGMVPCAVPL